MNATDDKNLGKPADDQLEQPIRWVRWTVAGLVVLLLLGLALGWMFRRSVAGQAMSAWCAERSLVCEGKFVQIGSNGATLRDLKVISGQDVPFEALQVSASLDWPRLFTPKVTGITVDRPVVRGTLDASGIGFYGMERLAQPSGSGSPGGALPPVEITDGRVLFETDAGTLSATVSLSGTFPEKGALALALDPAALKGPDSEFIWSKGVIDLVADRGQVSGDAAVMLERADLRGISVTDAAFEAQVDAAEAGEGPMQLNWTGAVASAQFPGGALNAARTSGEATFTELPALSAKDVLAALTTAVFSLDTGKVSQEGYGADAAHLDADLKGDAGNIGGPVSLLATGVMLPQGGGETLSARGIFSRSAEGSLLFAGSASAGGAHVTPDLRGQLIAPLAFPGILADHGASLRAALDRALGRFDLSMDLSAGTKDGVFSLSSRTPTVLKAASGLRLSASPSGEGPWLAIHGGERTLSADVKLEGGGAPVLAIGLDTLHQGAGGLEIQTHALNLSPWTAGGRTLSADLKAVRLSSTPDLFDLLSQGRISLSGKVYGLALDRTNLVGGLRASREAGIWRVQAEGAKCFDLSSQGFGFGAIRVQPVRMDVCPKNGAFVRKGTGPPSGSVTLGDVTLPFESVSTAGILDLSKAVVDWSSNGGLSMTVLADQLDLPMTIGSRTLSISGTSPRMGVVSGKGSPKLSARLGMTEFGGTLIPANVSAASFSFDGVSASGGVSGNLTAKGVLIRDYRDDPLYQPLASDLTATLTKGQLAMSGPLRLKAGGITVADTAMDLDVIRLNGTAHIQTRPLVFRSGGLQPVMLSDRLRGVFTDATGKMSGMADIDIKAGKLSGTGEVSAESFSFQTTRFGRVEDVNGKVRFSDLLALTTEPGQQVTVGAMNVGVPLQDGRFAFHLTGGKALGVETAVFPFAGGRIFLQPMDWTLGGDNQRVEVSAERIELSNLIEVLKLPDTQASGTLSGRFPIDFIGSRVEVSDARLFADAKGGQIAYTGGALEEASQTDTNAKLAFDALRDLEFSVLEVGLTGDMADRMVATLHIVGRNNQPLGFGRKLTLPKGQAFEFNLSLDAPLMQLLDSSKYAAQQDKFVGIVVDLVNKDRSTPDE